jgi:hypothetical protein
MLKSHLWWASGLAAVGALHLAGATSPVRRMEQEIETWKTNTEKLFGSSDDCALVCVDWADKWTFPGLGKETREDIKISKIMEEMDKVSHRTNVAVWTAALGTREADGRSILTMSDRAGAFHANDSLDISIGVGIAPEDKIKFDKALNGENYGAPKTQLPAELRLIYTLNKSREGQQAAVNLYRAETLRLYNSAGDYQTHMKNIANATNAGLLWQASKLAAAK